MRMQSQRFAGYSLIWWHLLFNERLRHQGKTSLALASSEIWREYPFHLHIPHQCCFISVLAPIKFLWWSQKWGPSKWTTFRLLYIALEGWIVWAISNVERRPSWSRSMIWIWHECLCTLGKNPGPGSCRRRIVIRNVAGESTSARTWTGNGTPGVVWSVFEVDTRTGAPSPRRKSSLDFLIESERIEREISVRGVVKSGGTQEKVMRVSIEGIHTRPPKTIQVSYVDTAGMVQLETYHSGRSVKDGAAEPDVDLDVKRTWPNHGLNESSHEKGLKDSALLDDSSAHSPSFIY